MKTATLPGATQTNLNDLTTERKVRKFAGNIDISQFSTVKGTRKAIWRLLTLTSVFFIMQLVALGQTAGPNYPGTGADVTGIGTVTWTNTGNLGANDNSYTQISLTSGNTASHYLQATNYGFTLPSDVLITGIQVTIGRYQNNTGNGNDIRDVVVQLLKGGALAGSNLAATGTEWPNSFTGEQPANYGGTTNLWGTTWTATEINASDFGVALAINTSNTTRIGYVDYITITVTYTNPPLYFRSIASGNWNLTGTWEQSADNSAWVSATRTPTSTDNNITIRNGDNVTVSASVDADQCTIETGGTVTVNSGQTWTIANGAGPDLTVNGTVVNSGTISISGGAAANFSSGSTYNHSQNGGTIPAATWDVNSTCLISGITTSVPSGLGQSFGNFTWNCASQTGAISFAGALLTVNGNLTVANTNTGSTRLSNSGVNATFNLGGDYIQTGGTFYYAGTSGSNTWIVNVNGNFSLSGGTLDMNGNSGSTTLNVKGNFSLSGSGTLTESASGTCNINFNGTGTKTYSKTGGTISNTINFAVLNNAVVDFGTSVIDGSNGTFNLNAGGGIITANTQGLAPTSNNTGTIQVGGIKTYSTSADYTYNGTSSQITGSGFTGARNLTIDNASGVSLSAGVTVSGLLNMTNGTLNLANFNLNTASITGSGNISNNSTGTATLTVNGSGSSTYAGAILNGTSPSDMITALTKSGSGSLTLTNSAFTYTGATTITAGDLILNPGNTTASFESPVVLNGGALSTIGIATGTTITSSSTLELNANSSIDLGSNVHSLIFAPSAAITWAGTALTINGWVGGYGTSGTHGRIFFGNINGLNDNKLAKVSFTGYPGTSTLIGSGGELVPLQITGPVLAISGTTDNGSACVGSPASPVIYTITNIGSTADNVNVTSDDGQFVVSNLSSTTIIGSGGTATFEVTFTPGSLGSQSAVITVTSTSSGSNSPVTTLTGIGVAPPTASAGGSQTICPNGAATVSGASASGGTILWTENGAGSITSGSSTLTPTYTSAAGDAGNVVTLTMTVSNGLCSPAVAYYTVNVDAFPTANAGPDQSTCVGGTITLAGSIGGGATISSWSAPSGSFGNPSALNSTYTPSITSGSVVLTLTGTNPLCTSAISTMLVTINPPPTVTPAAICQGGSGTLTASCTSTNGTIGPNFAGSGATGGGSGTAWSNAGNINADDDNVASVSLSGNGSSQNLNATNFGFNSIPSNATITGITVSINRWGSSTSGSGIRDVTVQLLKAGTPVGDNEAITGTSWPTSTSTVIDYVGSTDPLWGTTWTPADINNVSNFGVTLDTRNNNSSNTRVANVDYIAITITYTVSGSLDWYTVSSGGSIVQSGSPFNPVGDAEVIAAGAPYDQLNNSNTPGTYIFYAECSTAPGCRAAVNFVINPTPAPPTISPNGSVNLCTTGGVHVTLQSSASTGNQWYRDAVLLPGEVNQILNATQAGDYTVTVTNGTCTSSPSIATTVVSITPVITINPTATSTCFNSSGTESSSLTYSSVLNNPVSYSITWNAPSSNLTAVTDAGLPASPITITVPANTAPGTYTGNLTVKRSDGCVSISYPFTLTVFPNPVATFSYSDPSYCTNNPTNPSPIYSGGGGPGTFSEPSGNLTLNHSTGQITLATSLPGNYNVTNTVTINGCTTVFSVPVQILNQPTVDISYAGGPFCNNVPGTISVTRTLTNGTLYASGTYSAPVGLTINTTADGGIYPSPAGQITPSTSNPGTYLVTYTFQNGVCSNTATTTVIIHEPPRITTQPAAPASVCVGAGTRTISVAAVDGSLSYQWRKNGTPLISDAVYTGVNTSTLTITDPPKEEDGAKFDVIVSGSCSPSVTSDQVALTLIYPPDIAIQPVAPAPMCSGQGTSTISVSATGAGLSYQWYKDFALLAPSATYQNVTSATLSIVNPPISENGASFYVMVTGTCGIPLQSGSTSGIIVNQSPLVFNVGGSAISCALNPSSDITLSGSQIGVNYQLRNSSNNNDIGSPVPGDGNPITLPTGSISTTTNIIVVGIDATSSCTKQMTGTAIITVVPEISHNTITSSPTVCTGSSPDPIMGETPQGGDGDYTYLWQSSSDSLSYVTADGINDNQNYLPNPLTNKTWFRRLITSGPCTSISNSVRITINPLPAKVDVQPATAQFCSSLILRASNGGDGTIYYQGNIPGGQDTRFAQDTVVVHASGNYYFRAYNRNTFCWGPEGSATVNLTLPPATLNTTICQGGSGTLISAAACPSATSVLPGYPGSAADNAGVGSVSWTNPTNIIAAGSPYAVASNIPAGGGITHYLMATNYNFSSIPDSATINGIIVTINRESSGSSSPVRDNIVRLIRGGTIVGSNRANASTDWPTTMDFVDYGNIVDTWGITGLTPSDIKSPNFGVALSATNPATSSYPVVAGTATSSENDNTNTHTVALPAGIVSGDLLLVFWSDRQRTNATVSTPNGWTQLYSSDQNGERRRAWYRIATGTEGTTLTVNSGGGSNNGIRSAHNAYRIAAGTYQGLPVAGTAVNGNSTNPDPPNLISGFGVAKTLWIMASHSDGSTLITAPGTYSNLIQAHGYSSGGSEPTSYATMATARRQTEAASENPDQFTDAGTVNWAANTVAIQGVSGSRDATVDYIKVTVRYTVKGTLKWYTSAVGGTSVQSGSPFNPVGDPEVKVVYPELVNSNTPGTYPFWAECSNAPGCRALSNFVIDALPVITSAVKKTYNGADVSCALSTDGEITVTATGTSALMYSINNGLNYQSSNVFSNLAPGDYMVRARNLNLCESAATLVTITAPPAIFASETHTPVSCNGGNDGQITVTATGGTVSLEYSKDDGATYQTGNVFSNLIAGTYFIKVKDINDCVFDLGGVIITEPDPLTATLASTNVTCNGANDGTITISGAAGGYGTYEYSINGTTWQSDGSFTGLAPSIYDVQIRDAAHPICVTILNAALDITEPAVLTATLASTNVTCNGANDGTITISGAAGGYGTYEYSINGGGSWEPTGSYSGLAPGTYDVRIRDAAHTGCVIILNAALDITEPVVLTATFASTNVTCNGANDGTITISGAAGGYGTYEYSINGTTWQSSGSFTGVANGTYIVQVRDAAHPGCILILDPALVITQPTPLAATFASTNVTCNGANDGTITISGASGGYGTYEYSINGTTWQSGGSFTGVANGTYIVQVRDAAHTNCVLVLDAAYVITQPDVLAATLASTNVTCNGANDGTITISGATGGYGTYEYSINGGGSWEPTGSYNGLAPATHDVRIRDAAHTGCVIILNAALDITEPGVLTATLASTNVTCNGANDGTITISGAAGGYGTYEYSINGGGSWEPTGVYSGLAPSTYDVEMRDAAHTGCVIILNAALDITEPAVLTATFASTNVTCNGANDGTITISGAAGGYGTYEYSINGTTWQSGGSFTGVANGTYIVQMRDAAHPGCILILDAALVITQPPVLTATLASTNVTCNGANDGTITISGAAGGYGTYEYSINGGGSWQPTGSYSGLAPATHDVRIRDAAHTGCVMILNAALDITEPAVLTATLASTNVTCNGANDGTITISGAAGGYGTYEYSINGGGSWEPTGVYSGLAPSTYDVEMRDAAHTGCVIILNAALDITEPAVLTATFASTNVTCNGANDGTITISGAAGGYGTYEYSINGTTWQSNGSFTGVANGTYIVQMRDAAHPGCILILDAALVITQPPVLTATLASTNVTCNGANDGTITISGAAGGYGTYEYSINGGGSWQPTGSYSGLAPATHDVRIRDAAHTGCVIILNAALDITEPGVLTATLASTNVTCNGANDGTITISGAAGGYGTYEYSINGGGSWEPTGSYSSLAPGTYDVRIRDAAHTGCVIILNAALDITEPTVLTATFASTNVTCNGANDGTITISGAAGGYGTYEYSINGGGSWEPTGSYSSLAPGTYDVRIRDAAHTGCVIILNAALDITEPAVLTATFASTNVTCNGANDGTITISGAAGGYGTYEYSINGTTWQSNGSFTGVANGTYIVQVRDAAHTGCVLILDAAYVITQPDVLAATLASTNVTCNGANDGTITISGASGGYGTFEYSVNGTTWQSGGSFTGLAPSTYDVQVRDAAHTGCVLILDAALVITEPPAVTGSASITSAILCNGGTATVTLTGAGGTAPLSYTFNGTTNSTGIFSGIFAGNAYAWSISDANNCGPVTGNLDVTEPTAVTGSASVTTPILCNGGTATVTLTGAGGTAPLSYTFNGTTNSTGIFSGIIAGNAYAWSITDANNCGPVAGTLDVTQPTAVTGSAAVTTPIICNGGVGTVTLTGAGGTAPLSYTFNGLTNTTGVFANISAGSGYPWSITDANNCGPVTGSINVTEPDVVTVTSASVTPLTVCGSGPVTFTATASTGVIVWYDAPTLGNIVTPPASVNTTTTLYAEAQTPAGCISPVRTAVTVTVFTLPALPVTGSNTYTYNGVLRTATASAGVGEVIDWYTAATGGSITTAPSGINVGTYTAWAESRNISTGCVSSARLQVTLTINPVLITVTADAKTKVYGNPDPALTYQITAGALVGSDAFTGALTRAPGQNVGNYAILQGTLALNANYTLTYVGANFSITLRSVTVTADPKTKVYGTADPLLTYQITAGSLAGTDSFSGALTRDPGQNIGTYAIRLGTLALNSNYTLTYIGANFVITSRAITVTANPQTKVYGNVDPPLSYIISTGSLAGTDSFTGSLTRDPGENVGTYAIRQGTLALNGNYVLTFIGANLTITVRPITVTADAKTKVYGTADPILTYQITSGSLAGNGDAFSGSLSRNPGENVGTYPITQGTLGLSSNYLLTFFGANLTITPQAITVTADNASKIYGDADNLTYQITAGALAPGDSFTGSLAHAGGEDVGTHAITQGTLALNSNYIFTFVGAILTIDPRPVTVVADNLTKVYGDSDPTLTYTLTVGSLAFSDTFSGALVRAAGEDVGTYAISQGDLALNSNYILTFAGGDFTITQRLVTVTADAQTKVYGDPDPELTYHITSGNLAGNGDAFTGALTREPGEDVGTYAITQGTLALNSNYTLTYVGADFDIIKSSVAITVAAHAETKVYGDADPDLTYEIVSGALVGTDTFTGSITREPGENAGTYAITQGTLALSNNYTLVFVGAEFTITRRPITVTADPKSKVFGDDDPELTWEITSGELAANGDAFSGNLSREPGEDVGEYAITQGTLVLNDNYDLTFVGATFRITAGFEMAVYPNPFTDHLYFEFDLNHDSKVLLEVFDMKGRKLAIVFEGDLTPDHYRFDFAPDHFSEGLLIYRLTINGHAMVMGKAIHMR